jgi:hypothetical protein
MELASTFKNIDNSNNNNELQNTQSKNKKKREVHKKGAGFGNGLYLTRQEHCVK